MKKSVLLPALICLLFVFQSVFAQVLVTEDPYKSPRAIKELVYDGTFQELFTPAVKTNESDNITFYYRQSGTSVWDTNVLKGKYPGVYDIEWIAVFDDGDPNEEQNIRSFQAEIEQIEAPRGRVGLVYNPANPNDKQYLIDWDHRGVAIEPDRYYFRLDENSRYETTIPSAILPGTYKIEYLLWGENPPAGDVRGFELVVTIGQPVNATATPRPFPTPRPIYPVNTGDQVFYNIGDGSDLFYGGVTLPATGFPTRFNKPLAIQPENVNYEELQMRIQIPTINVDVELTGVPEVDGNWAVEWLNDRAGLLSGSAMPGTGYAMIAAHNHLNAEEIGPFALLFSLEKNDRIFVNTADGELQMYSVYANELLEPDDIQKLASIAESVEDSIILVTCENEMIDGGYMNRRVVFAKPL